MNFTPEMLAKVLDGTKTQTRRPVKDGEMATDVLIPDYESGKRRIALVSVKGRRVKWAILTTYAVCPGRGKHAVGRIFITDIRKERAIDITEDDARAEGFDSREAFFDKLRALYGAKTDLTAPYWVLTFELAQPTP